MDVKQFSSDKILAHLDRIEEWLETGVSRPITFELDMTNLSRLPDSRWQIYWEKQNPRLHEHYLLRWEW